MGITKDILKFTKSQFTKEIRIEAAYYLGQMAYNSITTLSIFISAGGCEALSDLLDLDFHKNKDLICLSVDVISLILT